MTQRDRLSSGGVAEAPPKEHHNQERRPPAGPIVPFVPPWEELFRSASQEQQKELLSLAERQGLLYAHQLPALGLDRGGKPAQTGRALLTRLLAGQTDALEPLRVPAAPVGEVPLDEPQREAVARALETPDVCLIQGLPGTGKSHLVAEIVTRAIARGERVLLLASGSEAIDRVLGIVGTRDLVCAIRCLGRDETPEQLPASSRTFTFAERARSFQEHSLTCARREVQRAEERLAFRRQEEEVFDRLDALTDREARLDEQLDALRRDSSGIAAVVETEASTAEQSGGETPFALSIHAAVRTRDERLASVDARLTELDRQTVEKRAEKNGFVDQLASVRPLVEAKEQHRWWTGSWWRATIQSNVLTKAAELQGQINRTELALKELEVRRAEEGAACELIRANYLTERAKLVEAEILRRQAALNEQEMALREERKAIQEAWQVGCAAIGVEEARPTALTRTAINDGRAEWCRRVASEEERLAFARQWADCLHEAADTLPSRLLGFVNLVAATTSSLNADAHFGESAARTMHFDLLVLERAHEVTESEFLNAARRARRWVLVGEPTTDHEDEPQSPALTRQDDRGRRSPKSLRPTPLRPGFFERLWQQLHSDPRRLPYRWVRENDRLCCQLRPVPDHQRCHLESETVADAPDTELRIANPPGRAPYLAEVLFPNDTSIYAAKQYIFRELAELPINTHGHSARWHETAERLVLRLADVPAQETVAIPLTEGVRAMIASAPADEPGCEPYYTCCLEFDCAAGWERTRAESWVEEHLGLRELGRTIRLTTPHRMRPALVAFLDDVLFDDQSAFLSRGHAEIAVELVPVPPLPWARERRGRNEPRHRPVQSRGGAGLEMDLTDARPNQDRLPPEFRPLLPPQGLVNYMEAVAVVRTLEEMHAGQNGEAHAPSVAVIALYPAQAELIRLLLARSELLTAAGVTVTVGVPATLAEAEYDTVLISLTRSHAHRAVTFGDGPRALTQALTRARRRLVLFGDVGTMARRSQWEGAVDHLDESAALRERDLVVKLLDYIHGYGCRSETFLLREGGSTS